MLEKLKNEIGNDATIRTLFPFDTSRLLFKFSIRIYRDGNIDAYG